MQADEVRLRLVEVVLGQATRVGLFEPEKLVATCTQLEKYVLGLPQVEEAPTSTPRKTLTRPNKDNRVPDFLSS